MFKTLLVAMLLACVALPSKALGKYEVLVVNLSSVPIFHIYASPTNRDVYGTRDLLKNGWIQAGYQNTVIFYNLDTEGQCLLDIRVEGRKAKFTQRIFDGMFAKTAG